MCKCIEQFNLGFRETSGDPEAKLDVAINVVSGKVYPNMTAKYRKETKAGGRAKHSTIITVVPEFCPFCGELYDDNSGGL